MMPSSDIYVLFRDCEGGSDKPPCARTSGEMGAVSERGTEEDITEDGDKGDTNNVIVAFPGAPPLDDFDPVYSPLWSVNVVPIPIAQDDTLRLVDVTRAQFETDIKDIKDIRDQVNLGVLLEPRPMSEAQSGSRVSGNDGRVFFNCPSQVPADHVPNPDR